jgi:hypothetical protein
MFVSVRPRNRIADGRVRPINATEIAAQPRSLVDSHRFAAGLVGEEQVVDGSFEVGTDYRQRTGFEVIGRDGLTLTDE